MDKHWSIKISYITGVLNYLAPEAAVLECFNLKYVRFALIIVMCDVDLEVNV